MAKHLFMTEVAGPVLIKEGALYLVSEPDGRISVDGTDGVGLHHHDTRYLSRYELSIGGMAPMVLMASSARGSEAVLELSNYAVRDLDGAEVPLQSLGVAVVRTVCGDPPRLVDELQIRSFAAEPLRLELSLTFNAGFEDLFALRGAPPGMRGQLTHTALQDGVMVYHYAGADDVSRRLGVSFKPVPTRDRQSEDGTTVATYELDLSRQQTTRIRVQFDVADDRTVNQQQVVDEPLLEDFRFRSDDARLDRAMSRSFRDLALLQTRLEHRFIGGGLPWFASPFGRDSIIAALQVMAFDPRAATGTARQLAAYQGERIDAETMEAPGKIPHELRLGEMANLGEVPHHPSYLSIDATPLFLVLIGRHVASTGRLDLFNELRGSVEAALAWIEDQIGRSGGDYLAYSGVGADGLINQGWKDSGDGIVRKDGKVPQAPIALCEVQAYVYLAWSLLARAFREAGEVSKADELEQKARMLAEAFNRDFWMEDEGCYCLALERDRKQVAVVASNMGHALWSGIATAAKAARCAERMLRPDMSSGWGVRTLSNEEVAYNPLHYHLGSVWPFDNALLVEGLLRYGHVAAASQIFNDVLDAASHFEQGRLPEFYVGLTREPDLYPARCPFAEPLQAWSAGALPGMVAAFLGVRRSGSDLGVELDSPRLPDGLGRLSVDLRTVDGATLELAVTTAKSTGVKAACRGASGDLAAVIRESDPPEPFDAGRSLS